MSEAHFAILRRHMVEVIGIQVELASEELGKAALDERVLATMRKVPRHRHIGFSVQSVRLTVSHTTAPDGGLLVRCLIGESLPGKADVLRGEGQGVMLTAVVDGRARPDDVTAAGEVALAARPDHQHRSLPPQDPGH